MGLRVLGIDPGTHKMGVGCIFSKGNHFQLVLADIVKAPRDYSLHPRLKVIWSRLNEILESIRPNVVAIEDIFQGKNARSAFHLGLARGLVMAACIERNIDVYEYSPTKVKSVVTGQGRADKAQVKKMTQLLLGAKIELDYDATDALAVAICHASSSRLPRELR